MTQDEIQELEREANGLYQAGDYHRAREVWERILESDPENSRAAEGVRMASLLSENWNFFAQEGGEEEVSLQSGLDRILRMTQGGDFQGAFGLLQELEREFSDSESLGQVRQEVQNAYEMAPFLNEQLRVAREKMDAGEPDEARAACAKVLALDPTNRNARMMQEQIEYGTPETGAATSVPEVPATGEEAERPAEAETTEAELVSVEPPAETDLPELELVDLDELDEVADDAAKEPAPSAFVAEVEAAPAASAAVGPAELVSAPAPADEIDAGLSAVLGVEEETPVGELSLETPEPDSLAELEEPLSEPQVERPREEIADPQGLEEADTERFLALVEEGHRALDESRYQDAIELLSHALAMDESHSGAARMLEQARQEQAESHRLAEAKLLQAIDLFDSGQAAQAEPLFAQVLDILPDHHSAREYMARIEIERSSELEASAPSASETLDEPLDLPDLDGAHAESAPIDQAGISPGEVALEQGSAEAVGLAGPSASESMAEPEEFPVEEFPESAGGETSSLEGFPELEEATEGSRRRSRGPLLAVVALLLVGAGVSGWFYRDRIVALFNKGGGEEVLSHEQRASLNPPAAGETRTEAQILEMIEEAANGSAAVSAGAEPETVARGRGGAQTAPTYADVGRLLDESRTHVRAGRGAEALSTLKIVLDMDEQNREVADVQKAARLIVTAREGFSGGDYEESLRSLYRLDAEADSSLRPVAVGRWLDNTRWNFLLSQLADEQPWRVLDLTHASRGELQLRGADRDAVRPLIEMAKRWQYESGRELKGSAYHDEVRALRFRSFDE